MKIKNIIIVIFEIIFICAVCVVGKPIEDDFEPSTRRSPRILNSRRILSRQSLAPETTESVVDIETTTYDGTYPLTPPVVTYRIGLIADMDVKSKMDDSYKWISYYKKGSLTYNKVDQSIDFKFDEDDAIQLIGKYAEGGRGMELSELITFNGRLLTFDDRTGIIFYLLNNEVIPWVILADGDGSKSKGFKSEWATVKDKKLFVGSHGKEFVFTDGGQTLDPMYVKTVTPEGQVNHINWINNYNALRRSTGNTFPGYLTHESGVWSNKHKKWFFLPRKCSKTIYRNTDDEFKGCNLLISANEDFSEVRTISLGSFTSSLGFSSFKFIPNTEDNVIVAIQTEEIGDHTSTTILAFTVDGHLLNQQKIETDLKYEGFEFI